jgi:hypothetical protein
MLTSGSKHLIAVDAGHATLADGRLPRRVGETMRRRLGRMSPAARNVAAVAASMGRCFTIAQLAAVRDVPASTLLDPVDELLATELLTEGGGQLSFSHDLNREAVRASQPPSAAQALDRQVAAALLAAGALPVEVATQLASSAAPGDEVAITTLMKASDALASTDPARAAELARRSLDLASEHHPLRGPLVARVAVLLHAAGRSEEAIAFADGALRRVRVPGRPPASGHRRPRPRAGHLRRLRGELGPGQSPPSPAPPGRAAPPGVGATPCSRVGGLDRLRARRRPVGRQWPDQQRSRRAALHLPAHRQRAPPPRLREARNQLPPVHYIPLEDVDQTLLTASATVTYCPYKGDASYYSIAAADGERADAVWSYLEPYDAVADIAGHVAFYTDRVNVVVGT